MDVTDFIGYLKTSALFNTEQKQYFINHADSYPAQIRRQMIDKLQSYEEALLTFGYERFSEFRKKKLDELFQLLIEFEKVHQQEIRQAEQNLEKDLQIL